MKTRRGVILVALSVLLTVAAALSIAAAPAGKSVLDSERVVLENAKVRVIEYSSKPGGNVCGAGTHSHPAHVTIVLSPARDRSTPAGGKFEEADLKVGDVFWSDGETHTDINIGKTNSRLIVVEIK